jgi:hypothetical protein
LPSESSVEVVLFFPMLHFQALLFVTVQIAVDRFLPVHPVGLLQLRLLEGVSYVEGAGVEPSILVTRRRIAVVVVVVVRRGAVLRPRMPLAPVPRRRRLLVVVAVEVGADVED